MLARCPPLARASICYPGGGPGSSRPPPSCQSFLLRCPKRQGCCPVSLPPPPLCSQICCFPLSPPLLQHGPSAHPASERHSSLGCPALGLPEGKPPLPWLGNSAQACKSPCCRLFEARPPRRSGHFSHSAGCLGENWLHFPPQFQHWEKRGVCYHL